MFLRVRPMSGPELACKLFPGRRGALAETEIALRALAGRRLVWRNLNNGAWHADTDALAAMRGRI